MFFLLLDYKYKPLYDQVSPIETEILISGEMSFNKTKIKMFNINHNH